MTFGKNLQALRARSGLSQSALAQRAGIPVKSIQNWEIDRSQPRIEALPKLARALGVEVGELLAGLEGTGTAKLPGEAPSKKPKRDRRSH
jgi:transcriptional regulator with XRE-family HTH domain